MVFNKFLPRFPKRAVLAALSLALLASCIHKKYETPITKDTQQPDKVLFDRAIRDIERGRYEVARISLNTLMNTYESSEYLAKAKLAVADSWFREGGGNGMAQAEAEYKDFQLFYPNMEEAAQAQSRVCDIHYKEMDKSDRDSLQTLRAETECRALLVRYPNSKFAPAAAQKLRDIQESLAEHEFVGRQLLLAPRNESGGCQPVECSWWISIRFTASPVKPYMKRAIPIRRWVRGFASSRLRCSAAWCVTIR